jgi:AAA ATPase-like protein
VNVSASFIDERTRHFTGRQWVFDAIDAWLSADVAPRVFLLTGGPGTGKTAIAARIAQMDAGTVVHAVPSLRAGSLAYAHFCQAGVEHTLSPLTFVHALSEALANRYAAFRAALIKAGSRQLTISTVQQIGSVAPGGQVIGAQIGQVVIEIKGGDARPVFDAAVGRPIRELGAALPRGERIVILVDSLDEAS